VRSLFADGSIQLLCLRAGSEIVGYIYNLVDRGRVYNYQSGFNYDLCPKQNGRPGLVAHAYAVEFNRAQGHLCYDFMAGDSEYKQSLGVGSTDMIWLVAQRTRLRFLLEDGLRRVRAHIRTMSENHRGTPPRAAGSCSRFSGAEAVSNDLPPSNAVAPC
jgi:CelD/BcsL family acetyltransferase involved in cellulose biosynthesis